MPVLNLTLKKKWFDMILSGEKKQEYREIKPYWDSRLLNKRFDVVKFKNGYSKTSPEFTMELLGIERGCGRPEWGADAGEVFYVLNLGRLIKGHCVLGFR